MNRSLVIATVAVLLFVPLALARATNTTLTITGGPSGTVNSKDATFTFTSTGSITNYKCSIDGGAGSDCKSGTSYNGLADGGHTFAVQGFRSSAGPLASATRSWTIDTAAPDTAITTQIPVWVKSTELAIAFSASEDHVSFRCRLDGGSWVECNSPFNLTGLAQGSHTFEVVAGDPAGNVDQSPASASWQVDTIPPETSGTGPKFSKWTTVGYHLTANEPGATFQCRLDGPYAPCESGAVYKQLAQGPHTFEAFATDPAGNSDPTPFAANVIVDTTPPKAAMILPTAPFQTSTNFTVSWHAPQGHSGIESYSVQSRAANWQTSFPKTFDGHFIYGNWKTHTTLVGAAHQAAPGTTLCYRVRATDKAGNVGPWSPQGTCTAVPLNEPFLGLTAGSGWEAKTGAGYYLGTYRRRKKHQSFSCLAPNGCDHGLSCFAPKGCAPLFFPEPVVVVSLKPWSKAALLVEKCPWDCGSVRAYRYKETAGYTPLTSAISLYATKSVKKHVVYVGEASTKPITIVVRMAGRPVIDGVVISRASVPAKKISTPPSKKP